LAGERKHRRLTMINAQEIQGKWNTIRGQVKKKWGQLTDDDLAIQGGNVDQLVGRIQQKTGEGRATIEKYLEELTARTSAGVSQVAETAREFAQQAGTAVQDAGERLRERYGQVAEGAREGFERAEDLVRHKPSQSIAAAFGFGLVVGVCVGLVLRSR
jgi:uncharacterized protein YjbJ (UPF0337 family)